MKLVQVGGKESATSNNAIFVGSRVKSVELASRLSAMRVCNLL